MTKALSEMKLLLQGFHQVKFLQKKDVLENDKTCFHKEKLNAKDMFIKNLAEFDLPKLERTARISVDCLYNQQNQKYILIPYNTEL